MIYSLARGFGKWPAVVGLLLANSACLIGFGLRERLFDGIQLLDGHFGYGAQYARELFAELAKSHPDLLRVYGWTELTLDMVFPAAYTLLAAVLIGWLFRDRGRAWVLIPFAAGTADVLENLSIAYLALSYDPSAPYFLWAATAGLSMAKWLLLGLVLAVIAAGAALRLLRWLSPRS